MKDHHINTFYSEEDGGYIADIPDLTACSAFGSTPAEALREVEGAKATWIEAARAEQKPISEPKVSACDLPDRFKLMFVSQVAIPPSGRPFNPSAAFSP